MGSRKYPEKTQGREKNSVLNGGREGRKCRSNKPIWGGGEKRNLLDKKEGYLATGGSVSSRSIWGGASRASQQEKRGVPVPFREKGERKKRPQQTVPFKKKKKKKKKKVGSVYRPTAHRKRRQCHKEVQACPGARTGQRPTWSLGKRQNSSQGLNKNHISYEKDPLKTSGDRRNQKLQKQRHTETGYIQKNGERVGMLGPFKTKVCKKKSE